MFSSFHIIITLILIQSSSPHLVYLMLSWKGNSRCTYQTKKTVLTIRFWLILNDCLNFLINLTEDVGEYVVEVMYAFGWEFRIEFYFEIVSVNQNELIWLCACVNSILINSEWLFEFFDKFDWRCWRVCCLNLFYYWFCLEFIGLHFGLLCIFFLLIVFFLLYDLFWDFESNP